MLFFKSPHRQRKEALFCWKCRLSRVFHSYFVSPLFDWRLSLAPHLSGFSQISQLGEWMPVLGNQQLRLLLSLSPLPARGEG